MGTIHVAPRRPEGSSGASYYLWCRGLKTRNRQHREAEPVRIPAGERRYGTLLLGSAGRHSSEAGEREVTILIQTATILLRNIRIQGDLLTKDPVIRSLRRKCQQELKAHQHKTRQQRGA